MTKLPSVLLGEPCRLEKEVKQEMERLQLTVGKHNVIDQYCLVEMKSLQARILETSTSILIQYTAVLTYIGHCLVLLNYSEEEKIDCITLFNLETGMVKK